MAGPWAGRGRRQRQQLLGQQAAPWRLDMARPETSGMEVVVGEEEGEEEEAPLPAGQASEVEDGRRRRRAEQTSPRSSSSSPHLLPSLSISISVFHAFLLCVWVGVHCGMVVAVVVDWEVAGETLLCMLQAGGFIIILCSIQKAWHFLCLTGMASLWPGGGCGGRPGEGWEGGVAAVSSHTCCLPPFLPLYSGRLG